jgi:hypothetical protein
LARRQANRKYAARPDIKVPNDYKSVLSGKDPQGEGRERNAGRNKKQKELLRTFKEAASKGPL